LSPPWWQGQVRAGGEDEPGGRAGHDWGAG
jgi:hypothetical protein